MKYKKTIIESEKKIALIAHDNKKQELIGWAKRHKQLLNRHDLFATGTTGSWLEEHLELPIHKFLSGPMGGDQQIGAKIAMGEIDCLIFFWDPLSSLPHDPDVKALIRVATVWNIPIACNQTSADFILASPFMSDPYDRYLPDDLKLSGGLGGGSKQQMSESDKET